MENEKQKKILDSLVMNQTEINETNKQNEHSIIKQYSDQKLLKLTNSTNLPSNIQVHIRVRPFLTNERKNKSVVIVNEKKLTCGVDREYYFEYIYNEFAQQSLVFDNSIKNNIEKSLHGYNFCVFAYGQTGSGKTYTMGTNFTQESINIKDLGIVPRSITFLFDKIKDLSNDYEITTKISYLELYNEEIRDLINVNMPSKAILIQDDTSGGVKVSGITECNILCTEDALNLLWTGNQNRKIAFTKLNEFSSRSHSIYSIFIEKINKNSKERYNFKITFVDLAGSERLKKTGATGDRFKEGVSINSGLLALSKVIMALTDKDKKNLNMTHIPYRDSKLTRLLKDSLSGNSITLMIGCVSPCELNLDETLNTLNYSSFARSVKIRPMLNLEVNDSVLLKEEIKKLKEELDYFKTRSFEIPDDKSITSNNNLLYSLRINKIDITEHLNNDEKSLNLGDNHLNASDEKEYFRENLKIKTENEILKSENLRLKIQLEKYYNKENEIINKLSKAVDNKLDDEKLLELDFNFNQMQDELFLLDENFNEKKKYHDSSENHPFNPHSYSDKIKALDITGKNSNKKNLIQEEKKKPIKNNLYPIKRAFISSNPDSLKSPGKLIKTSSHKKENTDIKIIDYQKTSEDKIIVMNTFEKFIIQNRELCETTANNENTIINEKQIKFDFDTFKPCVSIKTNRSIINDNTINFSSITDFIKNLEEEISNKLEVNINISNLSKEKTTFMNLIQNHQDKLEEKILSLSKIKKNYEDLIKNLNEIQDKEKINYTEKIAMTEEKILSIHKRLEKMKELKENTLQEIESNELIFKEEISFINNRVEDLKRFFLELNLKFDKTSPTFDNSCKSININSNELNSLRLEVKSNQEEINFFKQEIRFKDNKIEELENDLKEKISHFEEKIFFLVNEIKNFQNNSNNKNNNNVNNKFNNRNGSNNNYNNLNIIKKDSENEKITAKSKSPPPRDISNSPSSSIAKNKNRFNIVTINKKETKTKKYINVSPGKNLDKLSPNKNKDNNDENLDKKLISKKQTNNSMRIKSSSYSQK